LGGDITSVKCNGQWLPLGITVDDTTGMVLTVDELSAEDAATLKEWIVPIAEVVGAEILISDDADAFKSVADELGLDHQMCKEHVKRNTEVLIENFSDAISHLTDPWPPSGWHPSRPERIWYAGENSSSVVSRRMK
jgi:hypothetical protein